MSRPDAVTDDPSDWTLPPDTGVTINAGPADFVIYEEGQELWRGTADQFAALMAGMTWEEVCITSPTPTHRRLVSRLFPIPR